MSYRKHLMTSDEPPSELYKATEVGTNLASLSTDCISRQAAIDAFNTNIDELVVAGKENADAVEKYLNRVIDEIKQLPPIQPDNCSEFPNNSDAISRAAAIDALRDWEMCYDWDEHCREEPKEPWVVSPSDVVNKLPPIQSEPHWIPVTERLPETSDAVLTTYIVNGDRNRRYVEESSYYGNDESWSSPWDEYRIAGTRIEVIAWMPLPEPYKGVTE